MAKMSTFMAGVVTGLAAAAIGQELAKDPSERTWRGKVAGVPYNFRLNDWGDIAHEYWNPESDQILTPDAIGLGWGINFAALTRRLRELMPSAGDQAVGGEDERERIVEPISR
jgi:hypothetical protein